jgi:hypothetical protein
MVQRLYRPLVFFLIPVLLIWGLVGCTSDSIGTSFSPVARLEPCNDAKNTFYLLPQNFSALVNTIDASSYDANGILNQQADALSFLVHEVKKWSVQHDVQQDDVTYRFTVTLISPELMLSIILAEYAKFSRPYTDAVTQLDQWMQTRQLDQQIIFLLTINSSDQNKLTMPDQQAIFVPIRDMTLETLSGLTTTRPQGEGMFDYDLDAYDGPIQYYFHFPPSVTDNDVCKPLLNPDRDMSFTVGISTVQINGKLIKSLAWNFDLARLIDIGSELGPVNLPAEEIVPLDKVPISMPVCNMPLPATKNGTTSGTSLTGDIDYWLAFSLCVWDHVAGMP